MKKIFILFLVLIVPKITLGFESNFYGKGYDGKVISIEGYIADVPKFNNLNNGKYQTYTFRVNAASKHNNGDEFISVTYQVVKNGNKVGEFHNHKGDKVELTGLFHEFKGTRPEGGIIGSIGINSY